MNTNKSLNNIYKNKTKINYKQYISYELKEKIKLHCIPELKLYNLLLNYRKNIKNIDILNQINNNDFKLYKNLI